MIVGGLLTVAPVFGPLDETLHYLADFIAERRQPTRVPDISFFAELLALLFVLSDCSCLPYRCFFISEVAGQTRRVHDNNVPI